MSAESKLARAIRSRAREQLRRSRDLWSDYKQMRGSRLRRVLKRLRFLIYFYPLVGLTALGQRNGPDLPMVVITLYSAATILTRAAGFSTALYSSGDLAFYMHVPVSDRRFFDHQFGKFLRASFVVWFFAFVVFTYVAAFSVTGPMRWLAAIAAATLHWLLVASLALFCQWIVPRWRVANLSIPLYGLAFGALFLPPEWIEKLRTAILPLPTAWIPAIFQQGILRGHSSSIWLLVPAVATIALLPATLARLRNNYPRFDIVYPLMAGSATAEMEEDEFLEPWTPRADDEAERDNEQPKFRPPAIILPKFDWNAQGWIERTAARVLGSERQLQVEFLAGDQVNWTKAWYKGLKITGVGALLTLTWPGTPLWVSWAIGVIGFMFMLPLAAGTWPAMHPRVAGGTGVIPMHAVVPLSFSQMSRAMLSVSLARFLAGVPFLFAYGAVLGWRAGLPVLISLGISLRVLIVLLSFQPYAILFRHSETTNDSQSIKFGRLVFLIVLFFLALGWLACVILFFVLNAHAEQTFLIVAMVGLFAFSTVSWLLYKRLYNRSIDVLRTM